MPWLMTSAAMDSVHSFRRACRSRFPYECFEVFKVATGHSPHIVRTLVHDALAVHGAHGSELARVLCGQTSVQTAKIYEIHAERFRAQKAQEVLAEIQRRMPSSMPVKAQR